MTIERSPTQSLGRRDSDGSEQESTPSGGHGLQRALRRTDGFEAQVQLLRPEGAPVQRMEEEPKEPKKDVDEEETVPSVPRAEVVFSSLGKEDVVQSAGKAIAKTVAPVLSEYVKKVHYNSLEDMVSFVDHLTDKRKEKEDTTAQEAFVDHKTDSVAPLKKAKGAQCVGQGMDIAKQVRDETSLPAYVVAAQFPGRKKDRIHTHGAAMIAFANPEEKTDTGYVLLDPGFNVSEPVVVTAEVPAQVRSFVYGLETDEDTDHVVSRDSKKDPVVGFPANKTPNNPEAISKMALLTYQALTVVNRAGKARRYLQLDVKNDKFKLAIAGDTDKKVTTLEIDTSDLEKAKVQIAKALTDEVAIMFGYDKAETLIESVFKVLDAKKDILALQSSTLRD